MCVSNLKGRGRHEMKGGENSGPEPRNAGVGNQWAEQLGIWEQVPQEIIQCKVSL